MTEPLGVLGAGWVGLVTAACFADLGHDVIVRDVLEERIVELRAGGLPIYEPGLAELIEKNRGRIRFTLEAGEVFERARIAFICVGTPPTYSGDADLSAVWRVLDEIPQLTSPVTLAMKSTVPVGTGLKARSELSARGLENVRYVSNPEFLAESTAIRDFTSPDRIVVGSFTLEDGDAVAALYEPLGAPIIRTDVPTAEMIKYASNAFLATKISFINEIANVCEETGADVVQVAEGMGHDKRIGPHFLRAGIGYSGNCLPKDVAALKQFAGNSGYHFQLLNAVMEVNELQKRRIVGKLVKHLGPLRGKTITLLGLAFKPNTNDMREASSLVLAARLLAEGAVVRGWDPVAVDEARPLLKGVELFDSMVDALTGADAAVIVTEWDALRNFPYDEVGHVMRSAVLIDGRNLLDPREARRRLFVYESIGRPVARVIVEEAIVLAGGKAERLGEAARGKPKALVRVGGRPLIAYEIALLADAGVERVIVSCAAGREELFHEELDGLGVEIVTAGEPEPLGRGGGLRLAAGARRSEGPLLALNGDELLDIDVGALLLRHAQTRPAATVAVAPLPSSFGVVDLDGDYVVGFSEAPALPYWVNCGLYVLEQEAIDLLPEQGDHERSTFPQLAAERRLCAFRHEGVWLTVNTPKDLRLAEEHVAANPGWLTR